MNHPQPNPNTSSQPQQANNIPQSNSTSKRFSPIFKRSVTWRCMTPSDIAYISKSRPKVLRQISINSLCFEKIGTNGIRSLRKTLISSKTLSSASFSNLGVNAKQLGYLLDSTNHWKDLPLGNTEISDEDLLMVISRLGKCKKLTSFPLPYVSDQQENINRTLGARVYQQFKGQRKLETIDLSFPFYNNASILKYRLPSSLKSLNLDFKSKTLLQQQKLPSFLARIQNCNLLESLILSFSREYLLDSSDVQAWTCFFQNTPKLLDGLHISLNSSADQQPEGIHEFIGSLKHLKKITNLGLACYCPFAPFQHPPFIDGYLLSVFNSLQSLTQLEKLYLKFSSTFPRMEKKDIESLSSMLQSLNNLKSLDASLPILQSPDKGLVSIAESFKNFKCLEDLSLMIFSNFSFKSMQTLSHNIAHLPLIRLNLNLDASFTPLYPPPVTQTIKQGLTKFINFLKSNNLTPFFSDLRNLTQLSFLTLRFSSFNISNREFKHLALALQKFSELSTLHLSLAQFDSAKDFKGLQRLFSCLKELPKLTTLNLNFEGDHISDREIEILSTNLAGCQSLSMLNLEIKNAAQLKDPSLYSLLSGIKGLLKLKDLKLLFEREEGGFSPKAESDFLEGLVVLKDLQNFSFVYNMRSMFRNNRTALPPNLQGYEKLRHLESFVANTSRYI